MKKLKQIQKAVAIILMLLSNAGVEADDFNGVYVTYKGVSYAYLLTQVPKVVTVTEENEQKAQIYVTGKEQPIATFTLTENEALEVAFAQCATTNASGYATFSYNKPVKLVGEEAVIAYQVKMNGNNLKCTAIGSEIGAYQGVLLYGKPSTTFAIVDNNVTPSLDHNDLQPTTTTEGLAKKESSKTYYALSGNTFKTYTGDTFVANKAYLTASDGTSIKSFTLTDEDMTGITDTFESDGQKAGKYIVNKKLIIVDADGRMYDTNGRTIKN